MYVHILLTCDVIIDKKSSLHKFFVPIYMIKYHLQILHYLYVNNNKEKL